MGLMRYGKAVQRLQIIAERCQRVSGLWDEAPPLIAAYAFGDVLGTMPPVRIDLRLPIGRTVVKSAIRRAGCAAARSDPPPAVQRVRDPSGLALRRLGHRISSSVLPIVERDSIAACA